MVIICVGLELGCRVGPPEGLVEGDCVGETLGICRQNQRQAVGTQIYPSKFFLLYERTHPRSLGRIVSKAVVRQMLKDSSCPAELDAESVSGAHTFVGLSVGLPVGPCEGICVALSGGIGEGSVK